MQEIKKTTSSASFKGWKTEYRFLVTYCNPGHPGKGRWQAPRWSSPRHEGSPVPGEAPPGTKCSCLGGDGAAAAQAHREALGVSTGQNPA